MFSFNWLTGKKKNAAAETRANASTLVPKSESTPRKVVEGAPLEVVKSRASILGRSWEEGLNYNFNPEGYN
jgi:hypothetical protein